MQKPAIVSKPDKELVREIMAERRKENTPPPTPEEMRRRLGWGMLANNVAYVR